MAFPAIAAAAAGVAGPLIGGLMAKSENEKLREAQAAEAASNVALQKEFAQNGLRWKVEDAKRAGIHPLFAMGAQGSQFTPVSSGAQADHSMSSAVADMGQNISRAVGATRTAEEKISANLAVQHSKAQLDGQLIDNQIKQAQLQRMNTPTSFPSGSDNTNFIPGQGNSGSTMKVIPAERTASEKGRLAQTAGWAPSVSMARTDTGLEPYIPQSMSESYEADPIGGVMWGVKNRILPNFSGSGRGAPPNSQLPKGYDFWRYSTSAQEWQPKKADTTPKRYQQFKRRQP